MTSRKNIWNTRELRNIFFCFSFFSDAFWITGHKDSSAKNATKTKKVVTDRSTKSTKSTENLTVDLSIYLSNCKWKDHIFLSKPRGNQTKISQKVENSFVQSWPNIQAHCYRLTKISPLCFSQLSHAICQNLSNWYRPRCGDLICQVV